MSATAQRETIKKKFEKTVWIALQTDRKRQSVPDDTVTDFTTAGRMSIVCICITYIMCRYYEFLHYYILKR